MPRPDRALVFALVVGCAGAAVTADSTTFDVDACIDGNCRNGRIHSVTVTADAFIVMIDPDRCGRSYYCPTRYDSFELEGGIPARVEGYEIGTQSDQLFSVHVPRSYTKLFIEGIGKRDRFASIDLEIYARQLRGEAPEGVASVPVAASARAGRGEALAVIFGVTRYRYAPAARFAADDAQAFRGHLIGRMGYDQRRVLLRVDEQATLGEFARAFSTPGWLDRGVSPGSDVIVYFAGHGMIDPASGRYLLLPHDADPGFPGAGYALDEMLAGLTRLGARSLTLILDAPFGGGTRDGGSLGVSTGAPPALPELPANTLVLLAADVSAGNILAEEGHGALTFRLIRGLSGAADTDGDGVIAATELGGFLGSEGAGPLLVGDAERVPAFP